MTPTRLAEEVTMTDAYAQDLIRRLYLAGRHPDNAIAMEAAHAIELLSASKPAAPFQERVQPWMMACFGAEIAADRIERNHRFFEEATEAVQANGMTRSEAHQLVDYTFDRPVGELHQEIGGVMVTLAALCLASGQNMHAAGETELASIWTKVEAIRAKQAAKPKHSPLPAAPAQSGEAVVLSKVQRIALEAALSISSDIENERHDGSFLTDVSMQALRDLLAAPQPSQPAQAGEASTIFKPVGRCECAFSQDECETCESNREAYREHLAEQTAVVLDDERAAHELTTVYDPAYVREKFADYQRQIDGLKEELAHACAAGAACPQPLTQTRALQDEQRVAIQECIDYLSPAAKQFEDLGMAGMGDSKHARCIRTLRALLTAAQPESGGGQ